MMKLKSMLGVGRGRPASFAPPAAGTGAPLHDDFGWLADGASVNFHHVNFQGGEEL
jgi:hypothetical protein